MVRVPNLVPRGPRSAVALSLVLAVLVIVLAALQYQWIDKATEAERDRMQSRLTAAVDLYREAFSRELVQVCTAFRQEPFSQGGEDLARYARLYETWRDGSQHPELVSALVVATDPGDGRLSLSRFDEASGEFRPEPASEGFSSLARACSPFRPPAGPPDDRARRIGPWNLVFSGNQPVLLGLAFGFRMPPRPAVGVFPRLIRYVFLVLNDDYIYKQLLPELSRRILGDSTSGNYQVAVFPGKVSARALYASDPRLVAAGHERYDVKVNLLREPEIRQFREAPPRPGPGGGGFPMRARFPLTACDPESQWLLAVRHQAGSVALAARGLWIRNLAISGIVLVLLIISVVMIIISAQKSQRLARLQMEFAAGISHEVRTPLAVISSAGDNLAEGVITAPDRVKEYGDLVRREARRLSGMVEQTLRFSAMQSGTLRYDLGPVDAAEVVRAALAELAPITDDAGFEVEQHCEAPIPLVLADPAALSRCVQNLVTNALKYGGEDRKITVRITKSTDTKRPVRISVGDHGSGILPKDLPYIFEPFYQGRSPAGAKSRGFGLGLALTKDMVEALGGRITVESKPGRGATFTLHLKVGLENSLSDDQTEHTPG